MARLFKPGDELRQRALESPLFAGFAHQESPETRLAQPHGLDRRYPFGDQQRPPAADLAPGKISHPERIFDIGMESPRSRLLTPSISTYPFNRRVPRRVHFRAAPRASSCAVRQAAAFVEATAPRRSAARRRLRRAGFNRVGIHRRRNPLRSRGRQTSRRACFRSLQRSAEELAVGQHRAGRGASRSRKPERQLDRILVQPPLSTGSGV